MDVRFRGKSGRAADISGTAEFDPNATSASISCCSSEAGFSLYQSAHLSR
jgi:hypothetical protein